MRSPPRAGFFVVARISMRWALGNEYRGFVAQTNVRTFDDACKWFRAEAIKHFPDSDFARAAG
jgi:hypothetical protein